MIISHSKRFIFIHNFKVAGISISNALRKYNGLCFNSSPREFLSYINSPNVFTQKLVRKNNRLDFHITGPEFKKRYPNLYDSYFKFGFVRDPWSYQVSLFHYILKRNDHIGHDKVKKMCSFDEFIEWRVAEHLFYQKDFFYENDKCVVDYIGRFETLNQDFSEICSQLQLEASLPHLNKSSKKSNYLAMYSQQSIDLVDEVFKEDIELFGYVKPVI